MATGNLARSYINARRVAEAVPLMHDALEAYRKTSPGDSPQLVWTLATWSSELLDAHDFLDAEPFLRECQAIRQRTQPDVWTTFNTQSMLGSVLLGEKRYADAEPLLLAGYTGLKHREQNIPATSKARLPQAVDRLIELYTATNKPDEVKKWQAERAKYPDATTQPAK